MKIHDRHFFEGPSGGKKSKSIVVYIFECPAGVKDNLLRAWI